MDNYIVIFGAQRERAIAPPWNLYAYIGDVLYTASELTLGDSKDSWDCEDRNVLYIMQSVTGRSLENKWLMSTIAAFSCTIGEYQVPNFRYSLRENGAVVAQGIVKYGNTPPPAIEGASTS